MEAERTANMTDMPLSGFKDGDTLYVQRMEHGYTTFLLCAFRGLLGGGTVVADVLHVWPEYVKKWDGKRISTVTRKCFLWGKSEGEVDPRCHWFKNAREKAT